MISLRSIARALDTAYRNKDRRLQTEGAEQERLAEARRARDQQMEDDRLDFLTQQLIRRTR
ncbi:MAG: hypothetical protein M9939_00635 [Mesorhizobium sp.]|nr:hypothetical protein [Mesorhizobium sp.]MCO5159613.1 hypothetical protein [Mesorhizobium sp.]